MRFKVVAAISLTAALVATAVSAQETARTGPPAVGDTAPDFEMVGVTRSGQLDDPLRLSDLHGKTVVLAFFYRARTSG
jgi:cytochrome oxidase Cu insertion factor (SCO1/SenC/PrrC family)